LEEEFHFHKGLAYFPKIPFLRLSKLLGYSIGELRLGFLRGKKEEIFPPLSLRKNFFKERTLLFQAIKGGNRTSSWSNQRALKREIKPSKGFTLL